MAQLDNLLINYFGLKDEEEISLLVKLLNFFEPFIQQKKQEVLAFYQTSPSADQLLPFDQDIISRFITIATSRELKNLYLNLPNEEGFPIKIGELIVDTIYDEARFRNSQAEASVEDKELFKLFLSYHQAHENLYQLADSVINSLLTLYEIASEKFEIKLLSFIDELLPILNNNIDLLSTLWNKEEHNDWLIFLIGSLKKDLTNIQKDTQNRFKAFFPLAEYEKLMRFPAKTLQTHLANAASENPNLKEAKALLRTKQEAEFFLVEVNKLEKTLNIPLDRFEEVRKNMLDAKFINKEFTHG